MKPNKFGSDKNPFAKVVKKAKGGATTAFGKAFAAARERGDKEFTFEGRGKNTRFTTETEEEQTARKAKKTSGPTPVGNSVVAVNPPVTPKPVNPPVTSNAAVAPPVTSKAAPGRVGTQNLSGAAKGVRGIGSAVGSGLDRFNKFFSGIDESSARARNYTRDLEAKKAADRAARIAKAKAAGDPNSAGSNLDVAKAQMGMKKGGVAMKSDKSGESKAMMKKEVAFMKKGAPKSMVKHEAAEMKMAKGGAFRSSANGIAKKGKTKAAMPKMAKGGNTRGCK
jgi:hypothetical protein